jgi:carboxymethylenebutenolidase
MSETNVTNRQDHIAISPGQGFDAYVSVPAQPNGRAIVVIQEIFGVTPHIKEVADRYAEDGYLALAPDLFWRTGPGISLSHSKEDIARAFEILATFNETLAIEDLDATVAYAKTQSGIKGVAIVGMCLGGKLAYLSASNLDISAAIAFYGVGIEKNLPDAANIDTPLKMYFGANDKYVSPEARDLIADAVRGKADVSIQVVDNADHGFYTRGDPAIIAAAHQEALAFLDAHMS